LTWANRSQAWCLAMRLKSKIGHGHGQAPPREGCRASDDSTSGLVRSGQEERRIAVALWALCMRAPTASCWRWAARHTRPENFTLPCQQVGQFLGSSFSDGFFLGPNVGLKIRDLRLDEVWGVTRCCSSIVSCAPRPFPGRYGIGQGTMNFLLRLVGPFTNRSTVSRRR
jgi:hypothetical protein